MRENQGFVGIIFFAFAMLISVPYQVRSDVVWDPADSTVSFGTVESMESSTRFTSAAANVPQDDPVSALALANRWRTDAPDVVTFVTADTVTFRWPDEHEVVVPLPDDTMVLAAAPYINHTHPCGTYVISGCRAELRNEEIKVTVMSRDGAVILSEVMTTLDNGFLELWLPRDRSYLIRFETRGLSAEITAGTFRDSPTCLTELKLL